MKLTPWFDYTTPPVRPGVYEVRLGVLEAGKQLMPAENQFQGWYAYWDGKTFRNSSGCPERANRWRGLSESEGICAAQWRGLAEEPKT